jgi:subtilisin family serine protease
MLASESEDFSRVLLDSFNFKNNKILSPVDYWQNLVAEEELKQNQGENIFVGIMDQPIRKDREIFSSNTFSNPNEFSIKPSNNHGTFIAGLIAGNGLIKGVSPKCKLIELPIYDQYSKPQESWIKERFEAVKLLGKPVIINVSQSNFSKATEQYIENLPEYIIIIASAGTDQQLIGQITQSPARLKNVIAVGSLTNLFKDENIAEISDEVDVLVPEFHFVSVSRKDNGHFISEAGDSFATAIVSGFASLILSKYINNQSINNDFVRQKLKEMALPISSDLRKKLAILKK